MKSAFKLFITLLLAPWLIAGPGQQTLLGTKNDAHNAVLVANTGAGGTASGVTSSGVNTTGANLIVVAVAWYVGTTPNGTLSDTYGNTWTALNRYAGSIAGCRIFYCVNPTVGAGHTFDYSATDIYSSITVQAWSGIAASPFDVQNGANTSSATSLATGSVTPSQNNMLLIAALATDDTSGFTAAIDSGFTVSNAIAYSTSNHEGHALAYKVVTNGAATNPNWTYASSSSLATVAIAAFKY